MLAFITIFKCVPTFWQAQIAQLVTNELVRADLELRHVLFTKIADLWMNYRKQEAMFYLSHLVWRSYISSLCVTCTVIRVVCVELAEDKEKDGKEVLCVWYILWMLKHQFSNCKCQQLKTKMWNILITCLTIYKPLCWLLLCNW